LPGKTVKNYLPSGTFVTTTLLSGVDAPTGGQADSNPLPILLRLVDNGQMPNFFRSYVENCHITGAAVGQLSSERAFIRLEMMSCVLKDGTIIERSVKGYVTGEDGKAGLRGTVVTKQGALLARSAAAGFLQGFGSSLNTVGTAGTVSGVVNQSTSSVLQSGLAQGSGDAFSGLANYYLERANETHAIIEISAGRIGEIIFTQGVDFGTSIGSQK
jgi:conjugal transfer pilus assembly protein TraB